MFTEIYRSGKCSLKYITQHNTSIKYTLIIIPLIVRLFAVANNMYTITGRILIVHTYLCG